MADLLVQLPQPSDALLLGVRPHTLPAYTGYSSGSSQYIEIAQGAASRVWDTSYSPDARALDQRIHLLLMDWAWMRQSVASASAEELEVNYDHMEQACAAAQDAPDMVLDDEDVKAYAGLSAFSYALDDDY